MKVKTHQYSDALNLLSEILAKKAAKPLWLIVCGGSALQAHGVIQRATKDVDVFAERNGVTQEIGAAYPLAEETRLAIQQVAGLLKLPENWLNASTSFLQLPLEDYPMYFWDQLLDEKYGSHVRISYLSIKGLITLKILAALQRDVPRDTEDLIKLSPLSTDITESLDWCLSTTVDRENALPKIQTLLTRLGHDGLIERYQ